MQPDEETGYAEEQPASNMAAPKLETVEYRGRSERGRLQLHQDGHSAKKTFPSVWKKRFVDCDIWQCPVESLVVHGNTAHQCQH